MERTSAVPLPQVRGEDRLAGTPHAAAGTDFEILTGRVEALRDTVRGCVVDTDACCSEAGWVFDSVL